MTFDFAEALHVDAVKYAIHEFPLNACLDLLSPRPRLRNWPGCSNGYYGTWVVRHRPAGRFLCLTEFRPRDYELLSLLFPRSAFPLPAIWGGGVIRGAC